MGVVLAIAPILIRSSTGEADTGKPTLDNWFVKPGTSIGGVPGPGGTDAYEVTNVGDSAVTAVLNDDKNSFISTVTGAAYVVDAWVRTPNAVGTSVALREMEYNGGTKLGQAQTSVWLRDTDWHHLTVKYQAVTDGSQIDVNALAWALPAQGAFDVGSITLSSDVPEAPPVPIPVPTSTEPPTPSDPPEASDPGRSAVPTTPAPAPSPSPSDTATPTQPPVGGNAPPGYHLAWSDEFDGKSLNLNDWNALDYSTYGNGNNELACLMNRPQNLRESDGALHLIALREATPIGCGTDSRFPGGRSYTSAMINTQGKNEFKYGYFEMRAKLPTQANTSQGLWPAFWMRPASGGIGELDVMEAIGSGPGQSTESNKVHQTIWYDYNGTYPRQAALATIPSGTAASDFHTYAILWAPGLMQWTIDGKVTYTRTSATTPWLDQAFNQPFYFRLNLAVGGNWPGAPSASTSMPASYDIDYLRVYQQ